MTPHNEMMLPCVNTHLMNVIQVRLSQVFVFFYLIVIFGAVVFSGLSKYPIIKEGLMLNTLYYTLY